MNYNCNCSRTNYLDHNYTYWEDREITSDEFEIINFLEKSYDLRSKSILHIGIGNSFFAKKFFKNQIFGITISQKEIDLAYSLGLPNYKVLLCDKYSLNFKEELNHMSFDLIVDTNLKSYSCCQVSFDFYMENLFHKLNKKGTLITSQNGMIWYKTLKPKLSFNFRNFFHFKLKEVEGNKENVLSHKELKSLAGQFNLEFSFDDKLCYLKK
ncbi:hypothetical protein [Candidatus Pelagibacter sp. HIMB1782]|uniref:hypothetical protein n=1 Tax=Candidatus Pelagibacter sp. HIMB1782 TaxID=3413375 RepID=UPI003F8667EE